jgi:hypothetical protein
MMTSERILSHGLDGKVRDAMELCLLNAVLGGGSLDGKAFAYANKHATYGDETAIRKEWFEGKSGVPGLHCQGNGSPLSDRLLLLRQCFSLDFVVLRESCGPRGTGNQSNPPLTPPSMLLPT